LGDPVHDGLRAGHADDAGDFRRRTCKLLLEREHRVFHAPGVGEHRLPELAQPIPGGQLLHERLAQPPLQLGEAALDGGLVDAESAARGQRASMACDTQQVLEVVPVERFGAMRHCGPILQVCAFRRAAVIPTL